MIDSLIALSWIAAVILLLKCITAFIVAFVVLFIAIRLVAWLTEALFGLIS